MKKKRILFAIILFLFVTQIHMIILLVKYPFSGIIVEKTNYNQWEITAFDPAIDSIPFGLKIGDIVTSVDNQDVALHKTIKWKVIEQFKTIEVNQDGEVLHYDVSQLNKLSKVDIQSISGEIVSLLIFILIFLRIGRSPAGFLLSIVFAAIAVTFMCSSLTIRADPFAKLTLGVSLITIPSVFLHFLIIFFEEKRSLNIPRKWIKFIYTLPTLFLIIFVSCYKSTTLFNNFFFPNVQKFILLSFILGILVNFTLLFKLFLKYRKKVTYESYIIKTVWFCLCISFLPVILLSLVPSIFFSYKNGFISPAYTGLFVMFFPASFAYLIGSKQLYDIHLVIRRILISIAISILPSFFLAFLVKVFSQTITNDRVVLLFAIFLLIFTIVLYSLEYFLTKLAPIMFPRKHYLQKSLKNISKNLTTVSSFLDLKSIFLMDLVGTLQVFGGAIVFRFNHDIEVISEGAINEDEIRRIVANQILEHPDYSIFHINQHEEYDSFLIMTQKRNNTLLGLEESQWLNLIITYLAVSLENIHLIRKLTIKIQNLLSNLPSEDMANEINWFRKLLFQLQEKERVRIATDLHDTTIQDLYFLKRRLMDVVDQYTFKPEDKQKLNHILEYIEIMNTNLRNSCFELNPYLLKETGLVETIQKLIDHEKIIADFSIDYFPMSPDKIESLSLDSKHHIFRIVQELINNAKKHSKARTLFLELDVSQDRFELQYEDDGVGFDSTQMETQEIGGHGIGMEQMRTRVYSLNGSFLLETAPGKGVKISITFPLKEGRVA